MEFQAAGVVGNPWWFQRQRLAVGSCARVSTGGLVPALADVEDLCEAGAPFGLKPDAILPAYGMAETTVAVSF